MESFIIATNEEWRISILLEKPILSVVVLCYNHRKYIDKCLESIIAQQTGYSYEILLADDCSPDGTAKAVAERYEKQVRILERKENLGLCKNMYDAYMQAQGKYIFTCSGDDYLPVTTVFESQVNYLEKHEESFSVTGWHEIYYVDKGARRLMELSDREYTMLDFLRGKKMPCYMGMIRNTFKKDHPEYLCQAGRNNEEIQRVYYCLTKSKMVILPELYYTYCYRKGENQNNYNSTHNHLEMLRDYSLGFQAVEKVDHKMHNFSLAKKTYYEGCIDYQIQDYGVKAVFDIAKVLGIRDMAGFVWTKLLMRLNNRKLPAFLLMEKRLIRRKVSENNDA